MTQVITRDDLLRSRVVSEDKDFMHLEIAKREDVMFIHNPELPSVFHLLVFIDVKTAKPYKPWEQT